MQGLRIRPARPEERDELEALQWTASLANEADRSHLEANPDAIELQMERIELGQVLVAELDGRAVGFAVVIPADQHVGLDGLFVLPQIWRQGIGAALVDAAAHEARCRGLTLMVVANHAALGFYQRCGFTLEGEAQTRFGPALRLSR